MKIGTDALLLAAWCDTASASRIVDFGCGSGIIALMVAQRAPESPSDRSGIGRRGSCSSD